MRTTCHIEFLAVRSTPDLGLTEQKLFIAVLALSLFNQKTFHFPVMQNNTNSIYQRNKIVVAENTYFWSYLSISRGPPPRPCPHNVVNYITVA